jgi:hypothetical protein
MRYDGLTHTGLNYILSVHGSSNNLLGQVAGVWTQGIGNVLTLPGQVSLPRGVGYVCLTSVNQTFEIRLATEYVNSTQLVFSGASVPNMTIDNSTTMPGPAVSLYAVGTSGTIFDFPYFEDFDSWPRCDPSGCSLTSGVPCPAQNGWRNPTGDDFDWSVHHGMTESRSVNRNTGPLADHTTNNASIGNYIYSEASPPCGALPNARGQVANLLTPVINVQRGWYLRIEYWMHMWGAGDTQLHIDMSFDNAASFLEDVITYIRGNKGDAWIKYTLELTPFVWENAGEDGVIVRFRTISGNVTEISFEGDVAIDDVTIIAYTQTPTPSPTPSPTSTASSTMTTVPTSTRTPTVVPTMTPSDTATPTHLRDYVPIGIPDPKQIVNARWATVHPMMVVVNEIASLQLKGLWLYGVNEKVDIKFAVWAHNCIEMGAGSKIATLDKYNVGKIQVPNVAGQYMLCIRHRQDWEEVAVIDVVPQNINYTIWGYTTCEQMLRFNPAYCGCWYQKGQVPESADNQPTYTLPLNKPQWLLPWGNQTALFEQGCCRRGTKERLGFDDGQAIYPSRWGVCVDHDAQGQLGDFSCPAMEALSP